MLKCYGRKEEIQVLELKKEGPALLIYGSPGVGKTTLLRHFYEGLLKRERVVPGYVNLYSGIEPFSRLFAHQLINLFNNLNLCGKKNDLRDLAASIKSYLGEEAQTPVMKNLLLHIRSHLITSGLYEIVRLAEVLWDEEDLFELSLDLFFDLKMEAIVKILEAFEMALGDFQLVFILDDFELMSKERRDLFKELLSFEPGKSHFYFSLSKDTFDSLEAKIKEKGSSLGLGPLDKSGLSEWINRESPDLLKERSIEEIYSITGGNPFLISEQIRAGLKEEANLDFVGQVLSKYDRKKKHYLSRIALLKGPLSTQEASRLLKIDESMTKLRLFEFQEDSLLRSAYLEREDIFSFDHSLKQERVISILKSEFDLEELYQEIASYFEGEISYPTEEDMACFFKNFHQTIYYYGKIKDKKKEAKEAYEFYDLLATSLKEEDLCASLTKLTTSSYFTQLKTSLKIILYELLSKCKIEEPTLFNETVSKLSRFINERKEDDKFLVEYSKALFYLANWASKKQKIRETNIIILTFSAMIGKHPKNEEIKIVFAYLFYNLIYDFSSVYEFGGAKNTLESLRSLMEKNSKVHELRVVYAESLAAISSKLAQDKRFDDLFKYLETLKSLAESKDPEILIEYTRALTNASFHLGKNEEFDHLNEIIKKLNDLTLRFPDIIEIKIEYAKSLVNVSAAMSEKGSFKESDNIIKALGVLSVREKSLQETKNVYFSSLFNLSTDLVKAKRFKDSIDILEKMKQLLLKEPHQEEILLSYARTIYNILYDLGKNEKFNILASNLLLLSELFKKNPHQEIELIYVRSIFNAVIDLAYGKRYDQIRELLSVLEDLSNKEFKNIETPKIYAQALFNVSSYLGESQEFASMEKALGLLEELDKKKDGAAARKIYLDALLNATVHLGRGRKFEELAGIIKGIEEFPDLDKDDEMKMFYARVLVNASGHLGKADHFDKLSRIMEKGRKMAEANVSDHQIRVAYLDILVNAVASLKKKDDLSPLLEMVERLKKISQDFPEDGPAAIAYTKSLLVLADELERRGEMIELNKLMATLENLSKENHRVLAFLKAIDFPLFMI